MTTLVTGAAGFVGLNIVRRLAEQGEPVVALARQKPDAATLRFLDGVLGLVQFAPGDVRDRAGLAYLAQHHQVRRLVHGAAVTSAEIERSDPATFVDINLTGTLNALEAARACGAERFVLISSSALYGAPQNPTQPIVEDQPLQIGGLYTICKQAGEQFCRRYAELFGLSAVAGRLGTAYGPMERPTGSRQTMSQVTALLEAGLAGRSLRIYGVERFRDVCFIDDVAEAFVSLTLAPTLTFPIYNVSAGTAHRLSEIARQVAELVPTLAWQAVDDPAVADLVVHAVSERGGLDLTRLQQDVGFTPRYSLDEGLRRSLAWLRNMQ